MSFFADGTEDPLVAAVVAVPTVSSSLVCCNCDMLASSVVCFAAKSRSSSRYIISYASILLKTHFNISTRVRLAISFPAGVFPTR